jgi:predicted RNA binding protein YcfA (HicA-like mRNA interferase family)
MSNFPTMKARDLLRILQRKPLSCSIMRTKGSHRTLRTPTGRIFLYAHHDAKELSGHQVRKVLIDNLGLNETEALEVLQ